MENIVCSYCGKSGARVLCSKCHISSYCGKECADADWNKIGGHAMDHNDAPKERVMDLILGDGQPGHGSIYLGSVDALSDPIAFGHIDSVVSVLGKNYDNKVVRRAVNAGKSRWHLRATIWDDDEANIAYYFDPVADWIEDQMIANRHILIHCVAGHSRSTTLLINYMLKYGGFKTVDGALRYIQTQRPTAHPNRGFMKQLRDAWE